METLCSLQPMIFFMRVMMNSGSSTASIAKQHQPPTPHARPTSPIHYRNMFFPSKFLYYLVTSDTLCVCWFAVALKLEQFFKKKIVHFLAPLSPVYIYHQF